MFRRLRASWALTKACFWVLRQDKELMLFPIFCGLLTILAAAVMIIPGWSLLSAEVSEQSLNLGLGCLALVWGFISYSIIIFFNVAVLSCVKIRLEGGDPTVADGFKAGFSNLGVIFSWAAVGGIVTLIMRQLEENLGFLGAIMSKSLGSAFGVASFFAIPVMVFEKKGPVDAFKRSGEIIKKTWGEALGAYLGFSILTTIATWLVLFSMVGSIVATISLNTVVPFQIGMAFSLVAVLVTAIVSSCLSQIFQAALYVYATTGEIPQSLGAELLEEAFQPKKGRQWALVGSSKF